MLLSLLSPIISGVTSIVDKVIPDKDLANKLKHEIEQKEQQWNTQVLNHYTEMNKGQLAVNAIEATKGFWQGGWRPAVGWTCVLALNWHYLIKPFIEVIFIANGLSIDTLPNLETHELLGLLTGLLGMAGFRGREKLELHRTSKNN